MNQKGIASISIVLFIVAVIGGYLIYSGKVNLPQKQTIQTETSEVDETNSFPVYPGAKFIRKEQSNPCIEDETSGFSICDSTTYTWETTDDFDKVNSWYVADKSDSGWKCSGGAGSYESLRDASNKTTCRKDSLTYTLHLFASATKTEVILEIPNKKVDETANWKTYKGNGFFFKHPNEMKITIDSSSETSWSGKYVDQDIPNQMMLKQQSSPFSPISIGGKVSYREYEVEVMSIDENEQIKLGDKIADSYIINCGVHCYYHIIRFQQNNIYYELTRDIAGGGLENSFQEILSTFEFTQ